MKIPVRCWKEVHRIVHKIAGHQKTYEEKQNIKQSLDALPRVGKSMGEDKRDQLLTSQEKEKCSLRMPSSMNKFTFGLPRNLKTANQMMKQAVEKAREAFHSLKADGLTKLLSCSVMPSGSAHSLRSYE